MIQPLSVPPQNTPIRENKALGGVLIEIFAKVWWKFFNLAESIINQSGISSLIGISDGWIRNDTNSAGIPVFTADQSRLWLGPDSNGNFQAAASTGNADTRAIYASNIYWDEEAGVWNVTDNGGDDWAAVLLLDDGAIGLACEDGLTLPTTRTNAQMLAAVRARITPTGNVDLVNGADESWLRVGNGSPETVVTAPAGSYYFDTAGTVWFKVSGAGNTGWFQVVVMSLIAAIGDLLVGSGVGTLGTLPVGADGDVLTADSGEPLGMKWNPSAGGAAWTPYVPTMASDVGILTTSTIDAAYRQDGKDVTVRIYWQGSVSTPPGSITATLPVPPIALTVPLAQALASWCLVNVVTGFAVGSGVQSGTDVVLFFPANAGVFPGPITLELCAEGKYEAA